MTAPTIHGDPELTAIVARLLVARECSAQRYTEPRTPRLPIEMFLCPARATVLAWMEHCARAAAALIAPGHGMWGPEADCMARYVLHGTDHADLCANGLVMFSMHLQAQEVAP